jgi:cytochrome c oxidase subunit 2
MSSNPAAASSAPSGEGPAETNHTLRFAIVWIVGTLIAMPLVIWVIGPLIGPGSGSEQALGQTTDDTVLAAMATPVFTLVVLYLIYASIFFRQERGAVLEGPAVRGHARLQGVWIVVTSALVLAVAVFGTVRLEAGDGAGSGSGPNPLTVPKGPKLPIQVIAQQWLFTYRYPTYGGVETRELYLPDNETVEFHVTSIDVIHSFWAYKLGVKADANPGVDNIAFVKPTKLESFTVRCAELCGIWHGYMYNAGKVVTPTEFTTWIHEQQKKYAPATKVLPKYSTTYLPEPIRRGE